MEKTHFEQAKIWLNAAEYASNLSEGREKYSVAVSMCIHSIIKANDSLTLKFMNITARRHDDARRLFEELIRKNFIKAEYSDYKNFIQEAINNKAKAEYRGGFFSKNDFDSMKKNAEKFIKMAGEVLK